MRAHARAFRALVFLSVVAAFSFGLPSCGDSQAPSSATTDPDIEGVIYEGTATDEALLAMLRLSAKTDPTQAAVVDSPQSASVAPKDVPITVDWHIGSGFTGALRRTIVDWLGPKNAFAHGAPVNGRAYFLVFSTKASPKAVRVFTTNLSYTFDAATYSKLVGQEVTLTITNAIFEDNRVAIDGGPFVGEPVSFSVSP